VGSTLSLHDALPISFVGRGPERELIVPIQPRPPVYRNGDLEKFENHLHLPVDLIEGSLADLLREACGNIHIFGLVAKLEIRPIGDRKSTRLNSSHVK